MTSERPQPVAGIVIPAHNEERTLSRLLGALTNPPTAVTMDIVVVCNGCTDRTAEVAASFAPPVRVIEIAEPSKKLALRVGDDALDVFPRVFIDADVEISAADVCTLVRPLLDGTVLAAAPRRVLPRDGVVRIVRWYYDVWEGLPQVQSGLFGRGVVALSKAGNDRVRALPPAMSDDLVMSEAFAPGERAVIESATVIVRPPRTVRDLLRRRIRVATGNAEADDAQLRGASARTSIATLVRLAVAQPHLAPRVPVFLAVTLVSRLAARRAIRSGDFRTWQRDESSRS